jgi:flagellar biosynthesis GTPase FlhF
LRYADKSICQHPYTEATLAKFLGWQTVDKAHPEGRPNHACKVAFEMLDAFELGIVSRKELRGVKRDVAREIISRAMSLHREQERIANERRKMAKEAEDRAAKEEDARKARALQKAADELERQAEVAEASAKDVAKEFATEAVKQTKSGNWSQRDVREAGDQAKEELRTKREQQVKTARQLYAGLRDEVCDMLNDKADERFASLRNLLRMDCGLTAEDIKRLREEVLALQSRSSDFAKELGTWKPKDSDTSEVSRILKVVG